MERKKKPTGISFSITLFSIAWLSVSTAQAALIVNPAAEIVGQVTVQPIVVSDDNGTNTANYFGNATQQASIIGFVDDIWAQAGLDIEFLSANNWNSSFANNGTNLPRPRSDLGTIRTEGDTAGVINADPNVINMFFVNVVPGFNVLGNGSAAGLAFINSNGIAQYVGSNLLTFSSGWETIAGVVAHEIGHNLGLDHNTINQNLMGSGPGVIDGERLNASQIANVLDSRFVVAAAPVPVPAAVWLLLSALAGLFSKFHINAKIANEDQALHPAMHPA